MKTTMYKIKVFKSSNLSLTCLGRYFCRGSSVLHVVMSVCIYDHLYYSCPLCFLFRSVL